jgi:Fic family protein
MRLVKKEGYYYLKHSFRKNGKVMTREKYLGKEGPKNIEEIKQELQKESQKWLYAKLEKIRDSFQQEWKRCPESAKQRENEEIAIAFTYNTNAIEGSTITLEETREIIIDGTAPNKPLKDIRETEAHFKTFLEMLDKPEKISKELLLKWHKDIFGETKSDIAGRFRDFLVRVGPYRAPDWQDVENLMKDFFKFVKEAKLNPIELAARAHYKFEKIHPFGDGNGRIGRLIMNHILWRNRYPMIIIEYAKRKSYYKALQRNEDGFANYFFRRYLTIHKKRYT